jgi:hypothetical protein
MKRVWATRHESKAERQTKPVPLLLTTWLQTWNIHLEKYMSTDQDAEKDARSIL